MTQAEQWKEKYLEVRATARTHYVWDECLDPLDQEIHYYLCDEGSEDKPAEYKPSLFIFSDGSAVFIRMSNEGGNSDYPEGDLPDDPPVFNGLGALLNSQRLTVSGRAR